jgi:hypothetical protein
MIGTYRSTTCGCLLTVTPSKQGSMITYIESETNKRPMVTTDEHVRRMISYGFWIKIN